MGFDLSFLSATGFYELTALLVLAATIGFIGLLLRQPMIVSFIAVGILAGPSAMGIVQSYDKIQLLAELGIAVLLFLVGIKLDVTLVRKLGFVSLATGLGQVAFTSGIGYLIGLSLGLGVVTSLYIAVALTFSSTIIIVKLLSDKREVDSLHGRIAIGFLIVQDIVVVLAMLVLSAMGVGAEARLEDEGGAVFWQIATVLLYGTLMLGFVAFFIRYIADPLTARIAHSTELLVTFAIAWAALLAALGHHFGFGKELGGLLAGISLASTPFREAIISRLASLRDFLLLFFFIALGTQLDLGLLGTQLAPAIVFSLFVLIGNPLIVLAIMGAMGYRKRTGFLAGLTVAQISEFSLIFMAMGVTLGHVTNEALGLVTLVGLITIAISVYMITHSHTLYRWCEPLLGLFERKIPHLESAEDEKFADYKTYDVVLFGLGGYGSAIAKKLVEKNHRVLVVDFNPDVVRHWNKKGYSALYGDATDQEALAMLPLRSVKWVISAMPEHDLGLTHEDPRQVLIQGLKQINFKGRIAVSTQNADAVDMLKEKGADIVFQPFQDAAERVVSHIDEKTEEEKAAENTAQTKKKTDKKQSGKSKGKKS